ncbi:MAG: zinc-dependent metalloprotease [Betaproteobacteria bacterium]|nr:zinc-dependent metalloprotease [Betaproteobacteria bacterium]
MGPGHVAQFRKLGNNVQFIARNMQFGARPGSPIAAAVGEAFSDSLLGSAAVASQPHPERKSVLVELNALLLTDLPAASYFAYGVHQRGYVFDARNSSIERVYATDDSVSARVQAHYANPKASLPPAPTAGPTPPSPYPAFDTLPDRRSLFLGLQYSFTRLPEPMPPRVADPRVGHFVDEVWDFTDDRNRTPRQYLVQRWRLEKKDPTAALSEPVKPIVYWIDRNVPEKYRGAVRDGILEWNKAFEKIGFKDAIRVEIQPESADWSTADARHAAVRWFAGTDTPFAIGPVSTDPRTGEILDAAVAIPDSWARGDRRLVREDLNTASLWPAFDAYKTALGYDPRACTLATDALAEAQFGLDLLQERGDIAPDSPEADAFVLASLKEVTMHEIGHTLGLRHNFRASTVYPLDKLSDAEFTRANGLAGSVMDYQPVNLALRRGAGGVSPVDAGALRLLGDRVRVQAARSGRREAGTRPHRRARRDRSAAGVLVGPGIDGGARPGRQPVRLRRRSAGLPRPALPAVTRAVGAAGSEATRARAALRRAAPQLRFGPAPDRAGDAARHQARGRHQLRARLRRHRPQPAHPGVAGQAARGAEAAFGRGVLRRQLPLLAGVPAADGHRLPAGRLAQRQPGFQPHRPRAVAAGGRARPAAERHGGGAAAGVRGQGERQRPGLPPGGAPRRAARGDLERAQDRAGHPAHPPQPAARAREPRRDGAAASVGDDARRCPRAAARRGDGAARRTRRRPAQARLFEGGAGASRAGAGDARRGAEGPGGAPGDLRRRLCRGTPQFAEHILRHVPTGALDDRTEYGHGRAFDHLPRKQPLAG